MSGGSTVTTVGGLLPRDLIDRVTSADATLPGIDPTDYGLVPGERLSDAITRSWNRLQGLWASFRRAEAQLPASDQTATALTRERWLRPLFDELGFAGLPLARGLSVDGKDYAVSHAWGGSVVVHLPGARVPIDRISRGVPGASAASPHGLVQEFLNRSNTHLWGVVSNGLVLRVLRDNASMTRQAYLEFDIEAMFGGEVFSDFAVLWLFCHRTRFEGDPPEKCFLEQWSAEAASAGTRALDKLRTGVEEAIEALGQGFLAHSSNAALRDALRNGAVTTEEYQRQLLRVVYRLLFLLVAESRDLLLDPSADEVAKERYRRFYSVDRVRHLASVRRGTPHEDLWAGLQVTSRALGSTGASSVGLLPLGSFLWSADSVTAIGDAQLENRHLLRAIRGLSFVRDDDAKADRSIDYRNLGAEELGSIYESLLELHARIDVDARTFKLETAAGNERKTTGSYYTPTSLINVLLDSALDPVVDEAAGADDPEAAILALKVLDPAAGSGHFLIAAAHRIAGRLASVRAGGAEPAPHDLRHALREVIARCIYGIDVNPMAVELCKVSLWMESAEPGAPLSFLDHHIVCGNSLLGTTPALLSTGLPDEAFKPLEGDDKTWVSTLRKRNKAERANRNQGILEFGPSLSGDAGKVAKEMAELEEVEDASADAVVAKEVRYSNLQRSEAASRLKLAADAWCAAFVAPKTKDAPVLTDQSVRLCAASPDKVPPEVRRVIDEIALRYRFLHLHVAFPGVFQLPEFSDAAENVRCGWSGGFDVVLGNPPWERVKLQEKEWFAARDPEIAGAPNAAARKRLIARLVEDHPSLHAAFLDDSRRAEGESVLLRNSGRYPLGGRGDVNTYAVFAELMRSAISPAGRVGVIVPTGIATDDTTKRFFDDLVQSGSIDSLYGFENEEHVFAGVHNALKFCLLTLRGSNTTSDSMAFAFYLRRVDDLHLPDRLYSLTADEISLLNPISRTCPVFRTRRDADLTTEIYRQLPILDLEHAQNDSWHVRYSRMFDMSNDSHLFMVDDRLSTSWTSSIGTAEIDGVEYNPLYEAKMCHHYNHRWADHALNVKGDRSGRLPTVDVEQLADPTFRVSPRYWVAADEVDRRRPWTRSWYVGVRGIARNVDARTLISFVIPGTAVAGKLPLLTPDIGDPRHVACFVALLSSFVADYVTRGKVGGSDVTWFALRQIAIPSRSQVESASFVPAATDWVAARVLELTYTAWDLRHFASDLGYISAPFRWDEERRSQLSAELDAFAFHLYGIRREDVDYIMDTFTIVKRKDEAAVGEYRTKRLILERFDAMADAEERGQPYRTVLDPPPAHPSLAHFESTRPAWAALADGASDV
jgi:hypothetical protein